MDNIEKLKNTIKELEEKLVKATEKEQLLQNIPREVNSLLSNLNGFIFRCKNDANWTMEYISEGFAKISGYTAADIISNKNISYSSLIHEDDQDKVWNDVQKAINRKKKWLLNYRLVNKKGHIAWVWEQGEGVFNKKGELEYLEGVIIDVTEKHEIEEKFAKNEFKYREIFNNIIDVYYEATIDGLILEISPSIKSIVGFSRKHMIGRNTSDFYADKNQREQLISELLINKSIKNYELVLIDKNGDHVNCYTSIVLLCDENNIPYKLIGSLRDISLRKSVESENTKLLSAIEQSPVSVVITNIEGNIEYINPKFSQVSGYSKKEILGANPRILKSGKQEDSFYHKLWTSISNGKVWKGEFLNKRKDGSLFWETATIAPIKDEKGKTTHYFAVKEDITSLKNIQSRLEESEEHYRILFYEAPNGYQSLNKKGVILEVNPAWCKLLGYSKEEAIGHNIREFLNDNSKEKLKDAFAQFFLNGYISNLEMTFKHKEGRQLDTIVNGRIGKNTDGTFKQTHCILSDISERKVYEKQLHLAKSKAEESDRLKTAFLANMSHEIRTPMNAILGFSNLLREPSISKDEMFDYVSIINQRGNDLLQIISDIIDISRIEAGDIRMVMEKISINHLIKEIHASFLKILEFNDKSHIRLLLDADSLPDEAVIEADSVRLKQVFENLLQNAIKFTSDGFIKIGYKKSYNSIEFFIQDSGIGIEPDKQKIVFERFRQANDTHTRDFGGTGLGLAISKNIVNLLGGEMTLTSTIGKGTTFFFTLPYSNELMEDAINTDGIKDAIYDQLDLSGKTILIVEDVSSNYIFLESVLNRFNATIIWAKDGLSAIDIAKNNPDIDLVLMDIRMPGINGYIATTRIREFNPDIPIIAQTAYALSDDREKAISAGCNDYLAKPINLNDLKSMLAKYI